MRSAPAEYGMVAPRSLGEALRLLASEPGKWTPIAGGTELMVQFGAGRLAARNLLSIRGLGEMRGIEASGDWARIGAVCTYTDLRRSPVVASEFPLLAKAASWTGSIANQNRGTLGGNIVNGSPAADSCPALLAYGAEIEIASERGLRRVPYAEFHTGYKKNALAADELLTAIWLPRAFASHYQYLRKVGPRNAQAISKVALAGVGRMKDGVVDGLRIAVASMSHAPARCARTEEALAGAAPGGETILRARAALAAEWMPLDDIRSTAEYRSDVAGNLLEEFLRGLFASAEAVA